MNKILIEIPTPKSDNCRAKGKFLVEYQCGSGLRRIPVAWKRYNHDITLEYADSKVKVYRAPAIAMPCLKFLKDDDKVCVVETISAENAIIETLLHELGTRIASKLRFADVFTYQTKFGFAKELYNRDGCILTPKFKIRGDVLCMKS